MDNYKADKERMDAKERYIMKIFRPAFGRDTGKWRRKKNRESHTEGTAVTLYK